MCWDNTEPGSKSGDKAFESDAMDTGNMMGAGECGVVLVAWVQKRKDSGDVPSRPANVRAEP